MLSLCREHGQVTDFYRNNKHIMSIVTIPADDGFLDIHEVPEYVPGVQTHEYNAESFKHVPDQKVPVELFEGMEVLYFIRNIKGTPRLTAGFKADQSIKILRREVLVRDGLEKL